MNQDKFVAQLRNLINVTESKVGTLVGRLTQPDKSWLTDAARADLLRRLHQVRHLVDTSLTMLENATRTEAKDDAVGAPTEGVASGGPKPGDDGLAARPVVTPLTPKEPPAKPRDAKELDAKAPRAKEATSAA